jgi:hypothetical protein
LNRQNAMYFKSKFSNFDQVHRKSINTYNIKISFTESAMKDVLIVQLFYIFIEKFDLGQS